MADFSQTRSEYLKVMMGERKNALAPYRPEQMNDLGDTSFDVASLSTEDINKALMGVANKQYPAAEAKNEESSEKPWWEQVGDFFNDIGTSITEGIFKAVDAVSDFTLGFAGGLFGGGWFGAQNDFTDWVANAMTDDRWIAYATKGLRLLNPMDIGFYTNQGGYWTDWDYESIQKQQERDYQGMDWLRQGGNFVGQIVPSIALAFFTGGSSIGTQIASQGGLAFASGMGGAQSRALSEGASFQEASGYGALKGAISGAISAISVGVGGSLASQGSRGIIKEAGSKVGNAVFEKTGSRIAGMAADKATTFVIRLAADSGFSAAQTALEPALQQIYNDNAWYNAYGTKENRSAYLNTIGQAAATGAIMSAVRQVAMESVHSLGVASRAKRTGTSFGEQYLTEYTNEETFAAFAKTLKTSGKEGRNDIETFTKAEREYHKLLRQSDSIQKRVDQMRAKNIDESSINSYVDGAVQELGKSFEAWQTKYGSFIEKFGDKYLDNLGKVASYADASQRQQPNARQSGTTALSATQGAGLEGIEFDSYGAKGIASVYSRIYDVSRGTSLKSNLLALARTKTQEGIVYVDPKGQAFSVKPNSDSIFVSDDSNPSLPEIEIKQNESGITVLAPKNAAEMQTLAALAEKGVSSIPNQVILPIGEGIGVSLKDLQTPAQVRKLATLEQTDLKQTPDGSYVANLGGGKSLVLSADMKNGEIVDTAKAEERTKPIQIKAEPSVVKEAAQAKQGKVYNLSDAKTAMNIVEDSIKSILSMDDIDGAKSNIVIGKEKAAKLLVDNLNLGTKEQQNAAVENIREKLLDTKVNYTVERDGETFTNTLRELLSVLDKDDLSKFNDDFDTAIAELRETGTASRLTKVIDKYETALTKWITKAKDLRIKKDYAAKLSRTRSKIKDKVTGDYDYGKVEERDIHTINMLAKPIASVERSGGTFKATPKTLDAFVEAQKYYIPENYEEAGSIDFSSDVKEALDYLVDLIKQDINNPEISAETYAALWDYQNKLIAYEKELARIEITERKPSVYAASAELAEYDMSAVQKVLDVIPREFGGVAGELFMKFGYGEITKRFVIDPIKAYGRVQEEEAKLFVKLADLMPKNGFHSKHVVGNINGVKVTRGQLISAYISTFLAKDNFDDVEVGGWGVRAKNGSTKWASSGNLTSARKDIEKLITDEDKELAKGIFEFFNGPLQDKFISFEKNTRHKVDVQKVEGYYPKFKEKDFRAGVESVIGHSPLFRNEKSRTGDKSGLVILDVMDVISDYIKTIAKMEHLLPAVKAATALRNSKTQNGAVLATEIKNKYGRETMSMLDKSVEDWFKASQAESDNVVQKALRFFMHGYATAKLADFVRPVKNYFSYVTSNVDLAKMPRAALSHFSEDVKNDVSWLIENEIYELKYRFKSADVVEGNAPTALYEAQEKVDNVLMFPVKGIDLVAMKDGLYAIVAEAKHRGIDIRSEKGAELVHNIYAMFYLSNVGSTPLHKSKMSSGALRYVFDVLAGAKRAQVASFAMQGSLYHQFKGVTQAQIDENLKNAKASVSKAEQATQKALEEYDNAIEELADARQQRDETIASKSSEEDIQAARDKVKEAKERVKDKRERSEQASESEAKARSEQRKAENAKEGYAQFKFAGGKRIPLNILAKAIVAGVLTTGVAMVTKWLYGKKNLNEYELKEVAQDIALNSFVNWLPVVADFAGALLKNYQIDAPSVSMINSVISAFGELMDSVQAGKVSGTMITAFIDILEGITGLPLATVKKYVYGVMKMIDPAKAYQFNSIFYNVSSNGMASTAKEYAEKNDISTAADLYSSLYAVHKTGEIDREVAVELSKLVREGYNPIARNVPEYYADEQGERVDLSADQRAKFSDSYSKANEVVAKFIKASGYKNLENEAKAKSIKKIYDLYYEFAKYKALGVDPESKLGKLLAFTGGDYDVAATIVLIERNASLTDTKRLSKKEQAIRMVNSQPMTKAGKLLTLYIMGYGLSAENKEAVKRYLVSLGFTKKQAEEFAPSNKK